MKKRRAGFQGIHKGKPVELLHLISREKSGEIWRVEDRFTDNPVQRDERIESEVDLRPWHGGGN